MVISPLLIINPTCIFWLITDGSVSLLVQIKSDKDHEIG